MIQRAAVSTLLCVCFFASVAAAHPMRQFGATSTPAPAPTLQQILDDLVVSGPPIDAGAPISSDLFSNSAAPMTVQLVADYTGKGQGVRFGMYDPDNVDNPAFILPNGVTPSKIATVSFNADDSIDVRGGMHRTYTGFEGPFGYFIQSFTETGKGKSHTRGTGVGSGDFFYTQDGLNPGDAARALVFQGNGTTSIQLPGLRAGLFLPSQFLIAWDTNGDGQFNDYLVLISNIVAAQVPEPSSVLLLGISSLALLGGRRARSALK